MGGTLFDHALTRTAGEVFLLCVRTFDDFFGERTRRVNTMTHDPPAGLGPRGRQLWADVLAEYELSPSERAVLHETGRNLDHVDAIQSDIDARGVMIPGSQGQDRLHPGLAQITALQAQALRALSRLGVLDSDEDEEPRAVRNFRAAQKAANARWSKR